MWAQLQQLAGIDRDDPTTWRNPWRGLNKTGRHGIYKDIGSPRMLGAIDQLMGTDRWFMPPGWGGFLVSFPDSRSEPWDVTADQWHWDGHPIGDTDGPSGLAIFTFFFT